MTREEEIKEILEKEFKEEKSNVGKILIIAVILVLVVSVTFFFVGPEKQAMNEEKIGEGLQEQEFQIMGENQTEEPTNQTESTSLNETGEIAPTEQNITNITEEKTDNTYISPEELEQLMREIEEEQRLEEANVTS